MLSRPLTTAACQKTLAQQEGFLKAFIDVKKHAQPFLELPLSAQRFLEITEISSSIVDLRLCPTDPL